MRGSPAEMRWNVEKGSGTLLGLAVAGGVACILAVALPLYLGLAAKESVAGSADASALAAADVASGIAPGYPCDAARRVAAANATEVESCEVDGLVVTVRVERTFLGFELAVSATAGPPGTVPN